MKDLIIREFNYSLNDAGGIIEVDKETFKECEYGENKVIEIAKNENNFFYVAENNEEIVGFIAFLLVNTLHYRGLWIDLIGVKKAFQDRGVGKKLIGVGEKLSKDLMVDFRSALIREDNISSLKAFEKSEFKWDNKMFKLYFK